MHRRLRCGLRGGATTFGNRARSGVGGTTTGGSEIPYAELTDAVAKRVGMRFMSRRAFWIINHSTGMLQGSEDMVSVDLLQS